MLIGRSNYGQSLLGASLAAGDSATGRRRPRLVAPGSARRRRPPA